MQMILPLVWAELAVWFINSAGAMEYGHLKPGDDQYPRRYCEEYGVTLTLIALDQLGNDIFHVCPTLVRDFFSNQY